MFESEETVTWDRAAVGKASLRKGWASISWRLCPPPTPHSLPPRPIPRFSSLWTGRQVVEKTLWNECVGVGREEDLGLES